MHIHPFRDVGGEQIAAQVFAPKVSVNLSGYLTAVAAAALYVPVTRTVNGHALSANVTVTASDVGAPSGSGTSTGTNTGDQTITLTGDVTGSGTSSFAATLATTQGAVHTWSSLQTLSAGASIASGQTLDWNSDLFLRRKGAANLALGAADAASPVAQTVSVQGARGGTDSNVAGVTTTITGSLGTGNGASGQIVFNIGTPQASGTTQHTAAAALPLKNTNANGPQALFNDGTDNAPGIAFSGITTSGFTNVAGVWTFIQGTTRGFYYNSATIHRSAWIYKWTDNASSAFSGSINLGFGWNASGVGEINNGTAGTYRDLIVRAINIGAGEAAASSNTKKLASIASIADATATTVFTVTVPNAAHSASIEVVLTGSLGAGGAIGANEATGTIKYNISVARTAGVNAVANISAAYGSSTSAVAGATTITVAGTLGAITGAVGASNTFTIQVTITKGGGASANHTCKATAEIINANATGISIA